LLVLKVDYLKQLNDTYGHHNSEAVLKHLVTVCQRVLRRSDSLARLGEATFATLLLDTDCRAGRQLAERLRAELHRVPLRLPTAAVYINASIGLTQWRAGDSTESFMQRADAALALAKANGGNRVELAA
jgi:diguanylate cyclase